MSRTALLAVLVLAPAAAARPAAFPAAKHGKGELAHVQGMPVLTVRGKPAEIGEQFGVLAVKNAPDLDGLYDNFTADAGLAGKMGFVKLLARRLKGGFPADHLAEVEAMVKASERDLDLALFANTAYDLSSTMGCSTVVVDKGRSTTGQPLFGRNFDWLPSKLLTEHTLIAVYHPEGKRSFATITITPIVGCISGMNDAGLAVTLNEVFLRQSKDKAPYDWDGTPIMLAYRRVLEECGTVAEAEKLLRSMRRTTTCCMTVCDKAGGAVFEITSKAVVRRECVNGVCCCTNHFRTDELATDTRCWRFDKLLPLMTQTGKLGVADVFEKLDAVHQGKFTLQSMVFEPAGRKLHLKYGASPATKLEAKTFDLGKMFDAK
jgi:hypothetical protein